MLNSSSQEKHRLPIVELTLAQLTIKLPSVKWITPCCLRYIELPVKVLEQKIGPRSVGFVGLVGGPGGPFLEFTIHIDGAIYIPSPKYK